MMSGIPLPQQFSQQPGGGIANAMQGLNALTQGTAQARYAPYTAYADAASKIAYANMLPYQIQAQVLSNPMMWMAMKDNPQAMRDMMNSFVQSVPQGKNVFGNVGIPAPSTSFFGSGLVNTLLGKLGIGSSQNDGNALNSMPGSSGTTSSSYPEFGANNKASPEEIDQVANRGGGGGSALVPSTQGGMAALSAKMTAPYNTQVVDPGKTYQDPNTGETISAPGGRFTTALQTSINAAQRVAPQLERIASEAAPFMTLEGQGNTLYQRVKNYAFGGKSDIPTKYAEFKANLKAAPEALVKSYGLNPTNETIERMADVIEPSIGETGDQYKNRILTTLEQIKQEQIKLGQSQLYGGIKVSPDGNDTKPSGPSTFDAAKMLDYKYSNADEFRQAMSSLSPKNRELVITEMKRRGWH